MGQKSPQMAYIDTGNGQLTDQGFLRGEMKRLARFNKVQQSSQTRSSSPGLRAKKNRKWKEELAYLIRKQ